MMFFKLWITFLQRLGHNSWWGKLHKWIMPRSLHTERTQAGTSY